MNYLTNYYKNRCEQLQEQINVYERILAQRKLDEGFGEFMQKIVNAASGKGFKTHGEIGREEEAAADAEYAQKQEEERLGGLAASKAKRDAEKEARRAFESDRYSKAKEWAAGQGEREREEISDFERRRKNRYRLSDDQDVSITNM